MIFSENNFHLIALLPLNWWYNHSDNRKCLINKWKSKVTKAEMHNYFEICCKMNISIYTENSDFINLKEVL
jgi:hypothetical protein